MKSVIFKCPYCDMEMAFHDQSHKHQWFMGISEKPNPEDARVNYGAVRCGQCKREVELPYGEQAFNAGMYEGRTKVEDRLIRLFGLEHRMDPEQGPVMMDRLECPRCWGRMPVGKPGEKLKEGDSFECTECRRKWKMVKDEVLGLRMTEAE